jgi:MoxR-like ATPase
MADRDYMIPEDIKSLAHEILDHRIGLTYESMSQGLTAYQVTKNILEQVRIP